LPGAVHGRLYMCIIVRLLYIAGKTIRLPTYLIVMNMPARNEGYAVVMPGNAPPVYVVYGRLISMVMKVYPSFIIFP
jgi:hypothetical protein